jgi:hypothetical protein
MEICSIDSLAISTSYIYDISVQIYTPFTTEVVQNFVAVLSTQKICIV